MPGSCFGARGCRPAHAGQWYVTNRGNGKRKLEYTRAEFPARHKPLGSARAFEDPSHPETVATQPHGQRSSPTGSWQLYIILSEVVIKAAVMWLRV